MQKETETRKRGFSGPGPVSEVKSRPVNPFEPKRKLAAQAAIAAFVF
jgi:hypothetical protein